MGESVVVTLRLQVEELKMVDKAAEKDARSRSNLIALAIRKMLSEKGFEVGGSVDVTVEEPGKVSDEAGRIERVRAGRGGARKAKGKGKGRGRGDAGVSVLSPTKGKAEQLREVLPLRGELGVRGRSEPRSEGAGPGAHEGHQVYRNGAGWWCADCKESF